MTPKAFLPKSLFGRSLLILVLPTVLIQLVMVYVFFDRHWDKVTRHMASNLTGEIAFFIRQLETMPQRDQRLIETNFEIATGIDVTFDKASAFKPGQETAEFPEFQETLHDKINDPFSLRKIDDGTGIEVTIRLPDRLVRLDITAKRLESRTTTIFLAWMTSVSALFLMIAIVFLRNQIRPIRRLAEAAESFGRGVDMPGFRPHGASEVRKAAKAFIIMRERIKRQLRTRTDMLAGISHDLRTPLTRMKLQLAMLEGNKDDIAELEDDVQQMEHMIAEYLEFARGEGREEAVKTELSAFLQDIVADYQRMGSVVALQVKKSCLLDIRPSGFRRMLHNLIDNALRYGVRATVTLYATTSTCEILIDDEGPGIPADQRAEVFKPFNRLDPSRNSKTGGVGLGLTIARDIVLAHGGSISLTEAPSGGLRVVLRLPL